MSQLSQKEAVFQAVSSVLEANSVVVGEGQAHSSVVTREFRAEIANILVEGFTNGSIKADTQYADDASLRVYASSLTSNWLRKDTRLNGNTKYSPKNPGSRTGSSDAQLKALRGLLTQTTDDSGRAEIQGFIEKRLSELNASKVKVKSISVDFAALPQELASKYQS